MVAHLNYTDTYFSSNSTPKNINKFQIENGGQQNAVRLTQSAALGLC